MNAFSGLSWSAGSDFGGTVECLLILTGQTAGNEAFPGVAWNIGFDFGGTLEQADDQ